MEQRSIKNQRIKALRIKIIKDRRAERARSRESAVCKICNKDSFTSEKQLWYHMKARHSVM